jgi:hypothetical protein
MSFEAWIVVDRGAKDRTSCDSDDAPMERGSGSFR